MIVLLIMQIGELRDSKEGIESTEKKTGQLVRGAAPIFALTRALRGDVAPAVGRADSVLTEARQALKPIGPVAEELGTLAEVLPPTLFGTRDLIGEALPLLSDLNLADLPQAINASGVLATQLLDGARLAGLIDRANATLDEMARRDILLRAVASAERIRRLLRVQRRTYDVQRQSLAVQRTTLQVQREALRHIRNIDQRTGGGLPVAP